MLRLIERNNWYQVEGKNSMGITIKRHSLQIRVLDKVTRKEAEKRVLELETLTAWPPVEEEWEEEDPGLTLMDAYDKWLAKYEEGTSTWRGYRSVKQMIIEPLALQGITLVKEVTPEHLDELQNAWEKRDKYKYNSIQSTRKYSSCLFNYCINIHEAITRNPWKAVKHVGPIKPSRAEIRAGKRKDNGVATLPLDKKGNANWLLIQEHTPAFARRELQGQSAHKTNPLLRRDDLLLALLKLMYETGLRRSDAIVFRPDWIVPTPHGGSYTTAQVKTGDEVTCFLPQELVELLRALPLMPWRGAPSAEDAGMFPFYDGSKNEEQYLMAYLNRPLTELGKLIGVSGSLHPHRFRDSFAVNMLSMGMSLEDVQRMLGHRSIATTEKHYAPYVLGMQEAVERRQAAARQALLYAEAEAVRPPVSVN